MKPLIICLSIFSVFPVSSKAEDPVTLGLRGAISVFAPAPEETSNTVRTMAAEMLARYVKPHNGYLLSQRKSGANNVWMEMKGLQIVRVTARAVSQADQANGILESYMASVDGEMYRTYDQATAKWSKWSNGRNSFMPAAIHVERQTNGQWIARIPDPSNLVAQYSKGDPNSIPHGTQAMPQPALVPNAGPRPAPVVKTATVPIGDNPVDTAAGRPGSWTGIFTLLIIIAALSAFVNGIKPKKGSGKRGRSKLSARTTPPSINLGASVSQPPPLPSSASAQATNPIDLMRRKENLMTPAEQSFFGVLEPIVRSSCMVFSKVRLADLFDVSNERGQQAAFNKIRSKHVDFVLTEPGSSRILCAIELDDSSHNRPDRIERDDFVNELFSAHGMPLLRVPVAWTYNVPGLRAELLKAGVSLSNAA